MIKSPRTLMFLLAAGAVLVPSALVVCARQDAGVLAASRAVIGDSVDARRPDGSPQTGHVLSRSNDSGTCQ